ncbi:MAG TPA: tetratricopeptide repeat protein [Candidatus Methylacidiphilales bacterium]|nr:tetratricopeptide repeat protein [Candidatus Methylacidiphilales bacterium]
MKQSTRKTAAAERGTSTQIRVTEASSPGLPSWSRQDWPFALALIFVIVLIYTPVWRAGFIWDDDAFVTANPCIIGPLGLKEIWTTSAADICPLALTTVWVEHTLWGLAPLPYHLINVFLHAACAVVLWRILRGLQIPGAWLGAALWAFHPVQTESVAWITEIKNMQSALFFLLSILFFVKYLKTKDHQGRNGVDWNYDLTFLFALLAMASKSSTAVLPVVLCLCAWWIEGQWRWRNLARTIPIFLLSFTAGIVSIQTQALKLETVVDPEPMQTWPQRLASAGDAIWFYLSKLLWPYPLMTIYPHWHINARQWISYLPLLIVIASLFLFWLKRDSWTRPWFFAFAYFLAALFPVLGFFNLGFFHYSLVADHFQYLASMGPLAFAAAGLVRLADWIMPRRPWLQAILYALPLLLFAGLSWEQAWAYQNEKTLWTAMLAQNPDCWLGYNNLGSALAREGRTDEAIAQFQKALKLEPDYPEAHNNLGDALLREGQVNEATEQFQDALKINPQFADAHYDLGLALAHRGEIDEGIGQFQEALKIDPLLTEARYNIGVALLQKGQLNEAITQFQEALKINPGDAQIYLGLGNAFSKKGQLDDAVVQFQKALEIDPGKAEARGNLGVVFLQKGEVDEAIPQFQKALEINPNYGEAHNGLGIALAQKGQLREAILEFQKALQLNDGQAQDNLIRAQTMMRQNAGRK